MSRQWIAILSIPALLGCSTMEGSTGAAGTPQPSPASAAAGETGAAASHAAGTAEAAQRPSAAYSLTGFRVYDSGDGPLWVFRSGSDAEQGFLARGEPAESATLIGDGPGGRSIRGESTNVLESYALAWRYRHPGFDVFGGEEGRLWVFREGGGAVQEFLAHGEPAKCATLIGEGPDGKTLRGDDMDVLRSYADGWKYAAPGFTVFGADGRLWVFREGSDALREFRESGEPAKYVTQIGAGPDGRTLRAADAEVLRAYVAARKGQS